MYMDPAKVLRSYTYANCRTRPLRESGAFENRPDIRPPVDEIYDAIVCMLDELERGQLRGSSI